MRSKLHLKKYFSPAGARVDLLTKKSKIKKEQIANQITLKYLKCLKSDDFHKVNQYIHTDIKDDTLCATEPALAYLSPSRKYLIANFH